MTVGKGEIENITIGKGGGGCSTNSHMTVGKEGGVDWRGREKGGREEGGGGGGGGGGGNMEGRKESGERWAWARGLRHGP